MASSLKAHFPTIGRILGETPAALYAYQRAFVRAGVLECTLGRGPGSGVRASSLTMAQLVIGMLTGASVSENIAATRSLAKAVAATANRKCPLTGATNFQDAISCILADEKLAGRVNEIPIGITLAQAYIRYDGPPSPDARGDFKTSVFVGKAAKTTAFCFEARIPAETVRKLASVVSAITEENAE